MRKLLCILLLALLPSFTFAGSPAWNLMIAPTPPAAGVSYADILFYDSFEGATNADKPASIVRNLQSAAALDNGSAPTAAVGSYSLDCPTSYDRVRYTVTSDDLIVGDHGRVGFYVWFDALPGNGSRVFDYTIDANNVMYVYALTSAPNPHFTFYYKSGGSSISINDPTNTIATGQWYFIEAAWNNTGNSYKFFVNGSQVGSTDTTNLPDWAGTGGANTLQFGEIVGNTNDWHIDQLLISNNPDRDLYAIRNLTSYPD